MRCFAALLIALIAACCAPGGWAWAADDIIFRSAVLPESPWVGQKASLNVDVLAKDGWAQLKKIHEIEVAGAYVLRLETQGTRLSEVIDGDSYTGQRYSFMIFAQRDGKLTIPPVPVDVEVTRWGSGSSKAGSAHVVAGNRNSGANTTRCARDPWTDQYDRSAGDSSLGFGT